jgi:hypothetical protein
VGSDLVPRTSAPSLSHFDANWPCANSYRTPPHDSGDFRNQPYVHHISFTRDLSSDFADWLSPNEDLSPPIALQPVVFFFLCWKFPWLATEKKLTSLSYWHFILIEEPELPVETSLPDFFEDVILFFQKMAVGIKGGS